MAIDLNAEPYNDDFNETKNFYQILFRPGYSVQARELTQMQTILRDQIKKFGNHIFKHGSIVIPGHSSADLGAPYVKVESTYNDINIDTSLFVDKVIIGATTAVKAIIKKVVPATSSDPLTFYVTYVSGGTDGAVTFAPEEELSVESNVDAKTNVKAGEDAVGVGAMAHISAGVYYVNGSFVYVEKQSTPLTGLVGAVNTKYTSVPNCHVLLKINESIVDHTQDESLLDNAQGAYNYAAPGADRLKIYLELTTLPLSATITNDFVEIMRYREGVLEEHAKTARYSELEKSLARRTYDESGNYVVSGLEPELKEHLKKDLNEGIFTPAAGGLIGKFVTDVSAGKAYISGFENEKIAPTRIISDKARTATHIKETNINLRPSYGQYLIVSDVKGPFDINSSNIIDLYDTAADLAGQTLWTAQTSVVSGNRYATSEGQLYVATNSGITGQTAPSHTADKINSVVNSPLWTADTAVLANSYVYYANRLYKVLASGNTGSEAPSHTSGTEVNAAQGAWDNGKLVTTGATVWYEDRRKDPDVSSLYKVSTLAKHPVPVGTNTFTGHYGGLSGGVLTTGTTGVTITPTGGSYSVSPTVSISEPDNPEGVQATATVTLSGTAVASVNITSGGSGYTQPPKITFVRAEGDSGTDAIASYTGSITAYNEGVEPRFLGAATVSGITGITYTASPTTGNGRVTVAVGSAANIENLQVGEYFTITGATASNSANAARINSVNSVGGLGWVVISKPTATSFTFDTTTALGENLANVTNVVVSTIGKMVNAKLWMPSQVVYRGDYVWVPGVLNKPHRVYIVTTVTAGVSGALGTTAPTHTTASAVVNGAVTLVYAGAPAVLEYAGSPVSLQYLGVPASFRYDGLTGVQIGTARAIGIDYFLGDPGTNAAIYKLWVTDVKLSGFLNSLDEVGAIKYNSGADYAYALTAFDIPLSQGSFTVNEQIVHDTSGRTATVKLYNSPTSVVYAYRHNSAIPSPYKGDEVRGTVSGTRGVVQKKTPLTTDGQPSLIFQLPKEIPNSLKTGLGTFNFRYVVQKEIQINITTNNGNNSSSAIAEGTILPIEAGSFLALGVNGIIPNSFFALSTESNAVIVNFGGSDAYGPSTQTIKVYCSVLKTNGVSTTITPKTKNITTREEIVTVWTAGATVSTTALSGGPQKLYYGNNLYVVSTSGALDADEEDFPTHTSGTVTNGTAGLTYIGTISGIPLDKCDAIQIKSITDSTGDITANYTLNNGQTDYAYLRASVNKVPNRPEPTGSVTVTYEYYAHSGNGDFFCIDSYLEGTEAAIDKKIIYQSGSTGINHDLTASIDFRPTVGQDGTFSGIGSSLSDLIISGTSFDCPLRYYVPRIDSLVMSQGGTITVIAGTPAEKAVEPSIPSGQFELNRFFIPAFTRNVADIQVKRMEVERFTMRDIKEIVNRVERIEEFSTLTASEVAITSYEIKDAATGLNRFKSGYLVESFKNPFTIARTTDGDYAASFVGEVLAAPMEELICDLVLTNSTSQVLLSNGKYARNAADADDDSFVIRGGCLMLPYGEEVFAQQPLSSRVTNLNPFLVIKWDGIVICDPPLDYWVEVMQLPTIYEKVNETVTIRYDSPVPQVQRQLVYSSVNDGLNAAQRKIKPAPIQLVAYRITQPDGHSYTTVGAPGKYEKTGDARVEVIGSTTINQRADGASTTRAIDEAARKIGGRATMITDDVYKQIVNAKTSDAMSLTIR